MCPKCSEEVYRVPRRFIDRAISMLVPVQRYKCLSPYCGWEGNITRDERGHKHPKAA